MLSGKAIVVKNKGLKTNNKKKTFFLITVQYGVPQGSKTVP